MKSEQKISALEEQVIRLQKQLVVKQKRSYDIVDSEIRTNTQWDIFDIPRAEELLRPALQ